MFQNCSPANHAFMAESAQASAFMASDYFDASKIPYNPKGRLIADLVDYPNINGYKAVAVATNGRGLGLGGFTSQEEANQVVLGACQIIAKKKCKIFAEGDRLKTKK